MTYAALIVLSAVFFLPFVWLLSTSLKPESQIMLIPPKWIPHPFQWDNYSKGLTFVPFFLYLKNTLVIAIASVIGVLIVLRRTGRPDFTPDHLDTMAAFADQAALAWQLAASQRQKRELDVLADRDRIARDLHDHVIQRLFAVGLTLQGAIPRAKSSDVQRRITDCVDDLQEVITEIRTAIFDLHGSTASTTRLRQRLDAAVASFSSHELHTTVRYDGPLSVIEPDLADHAEAVVREAVSNAVRHANATTLGINIAVADELAIEVIDDGDGIPDDITPSGLKNLRERALETGGHFEVGAVPGGGTLLLWSAPL
mgnify:CR=1 FL=1